MNDIIEKLKTIFSEFSDIKVAILYGSFARGREKQNSDIDIALAGEKKIKIPRLLEIQAKLSKNLNREIDLIDLNIATGTVFKEAMTKGKFILNNSPLLYSEILNRMLFEQADFEPIRNRILEERRKKVL